MASWQEERDRLIAQTQAFVQRVAAARSSAAMSPSAPVPLAGETVVESAVPLPAAGLIEFQPDPSLEVSEAVPPDMLDLSCLPIAAPGAQPFYKPASERADILRHVASFQARQRKMMRDRETYYELMQAQIRKSLGNDSDPDRL